MRAARFIEGDTFWQHWREEPAMSERMDLENMIVTAAYFNYATFCIEVVLNVLCYKWRFLAKWFFHIEIFLWMTRALIPVND
jgi:hypothetical protein